MYTKKHIFLLLLTAAVISCGRQPEGTTVLHWAARNGETGIIKALLTKESVDVNAKDKEGNTPLYLAVREGYREITEMLIMKGADCGVSDRQGKNLLHWIAEKGYLETVKLFIREKERTNFHKLVGARDKEGHGPVYWACLGNHRDVVLLLLQEGASVFEPLKSGRTLLHWAAENGHADIVKFLIANKVNVNAKDNNGFYPIHLAVEGGHTEVVKLLIDGGAELGIPLPKKRSFFE